jgi:hypothetical protein
MHASFCLRAIRYVTWIGTNNRIIASARQDVNALAVIWR